MSDLFSWLRGLARGDGAPPARDQVAVVRVLWPLALDAIEAVLYDPGSTDALAAFLAAAEKERA